MDLLGSVERRAREALGELGQKAASESWDLERIEKEKSLFMLSHEVTLCSAPGCLELVAPVPGFADLDLTCDAHSLPGGGSPGAP